MPLDGYRDKGYGEVIWDGANQSGRAVVSVVYFCRLKSEQATIARRMMLLK